MPLLYPTMLIEERKGGCKSKVIESLLQPRQHYGRLLFCYCWIPRHFVLRPAEGQVIRIFLSAPHEQYDLRVF